MRVRLWMSRPWVPRLSVSLALLVAILVYMASPCVALWRLTGALGRGDVAALEHGVDWPALRAGLKADIAEGIIGPMDTQLAANTLPPFGASFITGIADSAVEHEVTALNVAEMMRNLPTDEAMSNPLALIDHAYFESPTIFVVSMRDADDDSHIRLRLELRYGRWLVTRAWIPQDLIERVSQRT
jgi:hypothetical protein